MYILKFATVVKENHENVSRSIQQLNPRKCKKKRESNPSNHFIRTLLLSFFIFRVLPSVKTSTRPKTKVVVASIQMGTRWQQLKGRGFNILGRSFGAAPLVIKSSGVLQPLQPLGFPRSQVGTRPARQPASARPHKLMRSSDPRCSSVGAVTGGGCGQRVCGAMLRSHCNQQERDTALPAGGSWLFTWVNTESDLKVKRVIFKEI